MITFGRVIREVLAGRETAADHRTAHNYADPGKPKIVWDDELLATRPDRALAREPCWYSSLFTTLVLTFGTATVSATGGCQVGRRNPAAGLI